MNRFKGLAVTLAAALLVVPSAFAESRHSDETHHDRGSSHQSSGSHSWDRSQTHSFDRGHNSGTSERNFDRSRTFNNERGSDRGRTFNNDRNSRDNRSFDRGRTEPFRDNRSFDRGRSSDRGRGFERHDGDRGRGFERHDGDRGRAFFHEGRVSRFEHWNGGYRVWLGGAPYPFFIPEARFRLFPHFGVGLSIRLGGYWNPLGYYDYYDAPYDSYYGDGYGSPAYVRGDLTGIVESVDFRRGTVLVRDRASDRIVNVIMRGDDPRFGDLRIGDVVELSGDWTRIGTFDAYRIDDRDGAGSRYYER